MPTKADANRVHKLRAVVAQARNEGWTNEQLDEALSKLYRKSRATKKTA
jgi:hypothetical protein